MGTVENNVRRFRNPLDPPIIFIANKYGGSKAKELERFLKFAIVGISGAVIDFGMLFILQETLFPPISVLNVIIATTIAFVTAVLSNFTWTRLWVYPESRGNSVRTQLAQFGFISVTGWLARTIWIATTFQVIGRLVMPFAEPLILMLNSEYVVNAESQAQIGTVVSQLIAMVVVMLWNFFANRYWTYRDVE